MAAISKENHVFEHYSYLPPELRMMVVDEMEGDDRCRFRRCSKLSSKEATSSKKFLYSLDMYNLCTIFALPYFALQSGAIIKVGFGKTKHNEIYGFELKFEEEAGKNVMKYLNLNSNRELWRLELCHESASLTDFATFYFKNLLKTYRNTIKSLRVNTDIPEMINFDEEIDIMNNLEHVSIRSEIDWTQFFSKLRRPLKSLICAGYQSNRCLEHFEQICQISNSIDMIDLRLNYHQFLQLSAREIRIHIGQLTVEDISNFIKSWQNRTLRDNFKKCNWSVSGSNFDFQQLLASLEDVEEDEDDGRIFLKAKMEPHEKVGKKAQLNYLEIRESIVFSTGIWLF